MVKNKKNQFWIIQNKLTGEFLNKDSRYQYTKKIRNAYLVPTRSSARSIKNNSEIIQKVLVEANTIKVIKPEWQ
jgi:hypothetical protein